MQIQYNSFKQGNILLNSGKIIGKATRTRHTYDLDNLEGCEASSASIQGKKYINLMVKVQDQTIVCRLTPDEYTNYILK